MNTIFYGQAPSFENPSVFLAGPTPRNESKVGSWRPEASKYFEDTNFDVLIPESKGFGRFSNLPYGFDYVGWEWKMLDYADCILFWIPRDIKNGMPAFTTNIEWGMYCNSGKVIAGWPNSAEHMGYINMCCTKFNIPVYGDLENASNGVKKFLIKN